MTAGTEYLIEPQPDGSVTVISAADVPVEKDSAGNFKITYVQHRQILPAGAKDQWIKLTNLPDFKGYTPEHIYLMTDGEVLLQTRGGPGFETWWLYKPDINGNYANGTWKQVAQPPADYNPQNMNGAVLHSGKFLVVGGEQNVNSSGVMERDSNASYSYDITNNTWTYVAPPNNGQGDWATIGASPFVELADGKVMVGRNGSSNMAGLSAMLYDETNSSWTLTGTNKNTSNNEEGYTLLPNDKVLSIWNGNDNASMLGMAETYDPATGLWTQVARAPFALGHGEIGPAITMPNGKVLATGATGKNALYDPASNTWSAVPDFPKLSNGLQEAAADNEATVLPNGNVLVVTSVFTCSTQNCNFMSPAHWYEYDVPSNSWIKVSDDPARSGDSTIANGIQTLPLPSGQVMVTTSGSVMLYNATGVSDPSWAPVINTLSSQSLTPGVDYTLDGKQLAGLTQGAFWGDEQQDATNYGIVQITNQSTHHVFYARSYNFSNTSIGPNVASNLHFAIDGSVENGPSSLRVIASGFASAPVDVTIVGGKDLPAPKVVPAPATTTPAPAASASQTMTAAPTMNNSMSTASSTSATSKKSISKQSGLQCVKAGKMVKVSATATKCPAGSKKKA